MTLNIKTETEVIMHASTYRLVIRNLEAYVRWNAILNVIIISITATFDDLGFHIDVSGVKPSI